MKYQEIQVNGNLTDSQKVQAKEWIDRALRGDFGNLNVKSIWVINNEVIFIEDVLRVYSHIYIRSDTKELFWVKKSSTASFKNLIIKLKKKGLYLKP